MKPKTYTVLETIITVSGKRGVLLNSFDDDIPLGCNLSDKDGNMFNVVGIDKKAFLRLPEPKKKKIIEMGAILYMVISETEGKVPHVGDQLTLRK